MAGKRAWSLLTIEGARQYGGNAGYEDDPSAIYRYDSDVANHLQVAVGDVVIVRSRTKVLGIAEIGQIVEGSGEKERLRCPECGATNIKERARKLPRWSCKFGHEFEEPASESVEVTTYAAHYGTTFRSAGENLTVDAVHAAVLRPSDQMSIKELDLAKLESGLSTIEGTDEIVRRFVAGLTVEPDTLDQGGDSASIIETRKKVLREISLRRGQTAFRKRLIRRYGGCCQISGCTFLGLVEAAHIDPYSSSENNGVSNGILLRSDLHTLFDLGLIGIEPVSLTVSISPALMKEGYSELAGKGLLINGPGGLGKAQLKRHWAFFLETTNLPFIE